MKFLKFIYQKDRKWYNEKGNIKTIKNDNDITDGKFKKLNIVEKYIL
jgi:hypothetical protein